MTTLAWYWRHHVVCVEECDDVVSAQQVSIAGSLFG